MSIYRMQQTHTPWPVIWSRTLRSSQAVARHNALAATRVLAERRAEREEADRYIEMRISQEPSPESEAQ